MRQRHRRWLVIGARAGDRGGEHIFDAVRSIEVDRQHDAAGDADAIADAQLYAARDRGQE